MRPKRSKSPPRRLWVLLSAAMLPIGVFDSEQSAAENQGPDETVYRYDLHEVKS